MPSGYENLCLTCRHDLDNCRGREEGGPMMSHAIACVWYAPKLEVIKGGKEK
jgi:hypothetical protein